MLQFIYGLPFSGKTSLILTKVKELTLKNKQSVIIVPEQASFETEKAVLQTIGDSFPLNIEVLSFSRLYDAIMKKTGGIAAKTLKDSDKVVFMNKALKQVSDQLKLWGRYSNSLKFAKTMLDTIDEFKTNAVTVENIRNAILLTDSIGLKNKLYDLSLIYETYDLLISEKYIDTSDKLTKLYYKLENNNFFEGKTIFFDGFKGFTGQQFKIIDRVLAKAEDVYFSFTNNVSNKKEFDVFSNIRKTIERIEKIANLHNLSVPSPIILTNSNFNSTGLLNLEKLLSDNPIDTSLINNGVNICESKTIYDEAEFTARTIRKLVRTKNLRFRDFVIIARDSEKYAQAVEYACQKNNINCFFDKKISLLSFPLSIAAIYAIESLNFSTEKILSFHKSGIGVLTTDEISLLENYTFLWNVDGENWLNEWDMDVRGFVTDEANEEFSNQLNIINQIRKRAIAPILNFKQNFKENAVKMSSAIVSLFEECNVKDALIRLCKNLYSDETVSPDALKQCYNVFMEILDSLVNCFAENSITKQEYCEALKLALSLENISVIPQTIDQVIFGQADRIRPSSPKVAFILGANQGVFPKYNINNGIFAIKERKKLIEIGLEIADNEIFTSIEENYLVYCNLCSASDALFLTYSKQTLKGETLTPASFIMTIKEQLKPICFYEPQSKLQQENLPETANSAFSQFCNSLYNPEDFHTLKTALDKKIGINKTDSIVSKISNHPKTITKANAKSLYGKTIYMSATKFDTFNRCKFSYFCKYGLKVKKLQPAQFDVLQRGTIVHYVLERIITTYKENIKDLPKDKLDSLCDEFINEYLDSVIGYRSIETARHKFLISKISRSLKEVVYHLSQEFAQSEFKPTHCELAIGGENGIPLKFDYSDGEILINGSIDRVDEYNGYVRIVDYKTGIKTFKLPDILFGLNLQMLIYLYAVIRGKNIADKNAAGIFYMPSKRDLNNEGMAMNGLIQGNIDLVTAMEKENKGEYIPVLPVNKDGSISKTSTSYIQESEFTKIFDYIEHLMQKTGDSISNGDIEIKPIDGRESSACDYCDFKSVCAFENSVAFKVPNLKNSEVFEMMDRRDD